MVWDIGEMKPELMPIARVYAKAYMEAVKEAKVNLKRVQMEVELLSKLLEDELFSNFIRSPLLTKEFKEDVIRLVFSKTSTPTLNLLLRLARGNRLEILPTVLSLLREYLDEMKGFLRIEMVVAKKPSAVTVRRWERLLSEKLNRKVLLKVDMDPELLGGGMLMMEGKAIDFSLRRKLEAALRVIAERESWLEWVEVEEGEGDEEK